MFTPLHHCSTTLVPLFSMVSFSTWKDPNLAYCYHLICRRNLCSASSSDTLVAEKDGKPNNWEVVSKKEEEEEDLKSWMHKNGLPPCKVLPKEKPSPDEKHRPIHHVAADHNMWLFLWWVWFGFFYWYCYFRWAMLHSLFRGGTIVGKVHFLLWEHLFFFLFPILDFD